MPARLATAHLAEKLPLCAALLLGVLTVVGCQGWPFRHKDRTDLVTPAMRSAAVRELGARAAEEGPEGQQEACAQLAQQIQSEPDPIVRSAIQQAAAELQTPLASQMLIAGLSDESTTVRTTCCRELGRRGDAAAIDKLAAAVRTDDDFDVRVAAVDALGQIKTDASVVALAAALKDRDPAMQYAGVQAMRGPAARSWATTCKPGDSTPTRCRRPRGEPTCKSPPSRTRLRLTEVASCGKSLFPTSEGEATTAPIPLNALALPSRPVLAPGNVR